MKYKPPIENKETDELIAIANCKNDDWQEEAIKLAQIELLKRRISKEEQENKINLWQKQKIELEKLWQEQLRKNEFESYLFPEMIKILILAPFYLFGKLISDYTITDLKNENYKKKMKQRILLLILGTFIWLLFIIASVHYSEYKKLNEINNTNQTETET